MVVGPYGLVGGNGMTIPGRVELVPAGDVGTGVPGGDGGFVCDVVTGGTLLMAPAAKGGRDASAASAGDVRASSSATGSAPVASTMLAPISGWGIRGGSRFPRNLGLMNSSTSASSSSGAGATLVARMKMWAYAERVEG